MQTALPRGEASRRVQLQPTAEDSARQVEALGGTSFYLCLVSRLLQACYLRPRVGSELFLGGMRSTCCLAEVVQVVSIFSAGRYLMKLKTWLERQTSNKHTLQSDAQITEYFCLKLRPTLWSMQCVGVFLSL